MSDPTIEVLQSLTRLYDPPSGLSVVSSKFKPERVHNFKGVKRAVYKFANGFGASVIAGAVADGGLELAVLGQDGYLTYDTPITNNVARDLDAEKLDSLLTQIAELPSV